MSIKTYSLYDIAYMFTFKYREQKSFTIEEKSKIVKDIYTLLNRGFTDKEIFEHFKELGNNGYFDIEQAFANISPTTKNLLKPNRIYFHSQLILTSGRAEAEFDYETGEMIICNDNYYFENVASYTLEDIIKYYKSKSIYDHEYVNDQRIQGAFNWMIGKYDIELILFMIDVYDDWCSFDVIQNSYNPIEITNAYKNAIQSYKNKLNEATCMGVNKIVPRQRPQIS